MVSSRSVVRIVLKVVAVLLLVGSATVAYNLSMTSLAPYPFIGALTYLFIAFLVIGAILVLIY